MAEAVRSCLVAKIPPEHFYPRYWWSEVGLAHCLSSGKFLMSILPSPNIPWLQGWSICGTIHWKSFPWPLPWGSVARRRAEFFVFVFIIEGGRILRKEKTPGLIICPVALPRGTSVSLSFHSLNTIGCALCISVCLRSLTPCTLNSWKEWFCHITKICWEPVTKSPSSSFTILVLGLKSLTHWFLIF